MNRKNPRLQFIDAELNPRLKEHNRRAEKAADKAEAARKKIPKDRKKIKRRMVEEHSGAVKKRLCFEEVDRPASPSKLSHAVREAPGFAASTQLHKEVQEADDGNVGVESAGSLLRTAENGGRVLESAYHAHKLKPYRAAHRGPRKIIDFVGRGGTRERAQFSPQAETELSGLCDDEAERRLEKANIDLLYQKHIQENPQPASNLLSRWRQKQAIRKQYAAAVRSGQSAVSTVESTARAARNAAQRSRKTTAYFRRHGKGFLTVIALFLTAAFLLSCVSSCTVLVQGGLSVLSASTYPASDADMLGAEAAYAGMEAELQNELDNYETFHSGYDEYVYDLDSIGHDPYVLMSILSALHPGGWTLDMVGETLEMIFHQQYTLTDSVVTETRYDSDRNPYDYTICTVTLKNHDLSHLPAYLLTEDQLGAYSNYMKNLGNRPDLFPQSEYPNASKKEDYLDYDVPPEALEDETFAAMLKEAEKYLGYPYVWGGSSPSTSFDCSGFVSWVINHSGWNVGRLGAKALCNLCTPVSAANARPGDLVFFVNTYDAPDPGAPTHCGIYVGNSMMIHCGNPISYANLNSSYWQNHFYCYGRLP